MMRTGGHPLRSVFLAAVLACLPTTPLLASQAGFVPSEVEVKYDPGSNERTISFDLNRPIESVGSGEVFSYTFSATCEGEQCVPQVVGVVVGAFEPPLGSLQELRIQFGDHMLHTSPWYSSGGIALFSVPALLIQSIVEEADSGNEVVGTVGTPEHIDLISSGAIERLREMVSYIDRDARGIPASPVRLVGHHKRNTSVDMGNQVKLTLFVMNDSSATIRGWRGTLDVSDPFGDPLVSVQLTAGDSPIRPGDFRNVDFEWEDNQFIDDEVYDKLAQYPTANLTLTLNSVQTF